MGPPAPPNPDSQDPLGNEMIDSFTRIMKFFSLLLLLFIYKISCAQIYHTFPDSNARWNVGQTVSWYQNGIYVLERHLNGWRYVLGTDTVLNGHTYHKVGTQDLWSYETIDGNPLLLHNDSWIPPDYFGGIREDSDKKIWFINFVTIPIPFGHGLLIQKCCSMILTCMLAKL
ncbi:MAG: hypothetical protein ABIQ74_04070 [Chitinophagales bacterium]